MSEKVYTQEQLRRFEQGWCDTMVDIWHERMMLLGVRDTGALMGSVNGSVNGSAGGRSITHRFLEYGIYVAAGVGGGGHKGKYGYRHGNGGDLEFLDPQYREEHGLDKPRKRGPKWGGVYTSGKPRKERDWFARKYLASIHRLNEKEAEFYGEAYQGLLPEVFDSLFGNDGKLRSL